MLRKYFKFIIAPILIIFIVIGVFSFFNKKEAWISAQETPYLMWEQSGIFGGACDITRDSTGVYVVGRGGWDSGMKWRIEKRNFTDGSAIWSVDYKLAGYDYATAANGVAVDSTGIYIVGGAYTSNNGDWVMQKRNLNNGSLIWEKNFDYGSNDVAYGVAVDSTGVYIVGTIYDWHYHGLIQKRNLNNGSLIWERNTEGESPDAPFRVVVDSTGLYMVGLSEVPHLTRIEKRSLNDGSVIWTTTTQTIDFGIGASRCIYAGQSPGLTIDSTGIYVVGVGTERRMTEKRNLSNGSLIWSRVFGSQDDSVATGATVDSNALYITGTESFYITEGGPPYDWVSRWRTEKLDLNTGSLIWYITSDPIFSDPSLTSTDYAFGVAADDSGIYTVGINRVNRDVNHINDLWRVEKYGVIPAASPPGVVTDSATNITTNSATLNGNLNDLGGGADFCAVWFEWGETTSLGNSTPVQSMSSTGSFSADISGLNPNITYYFKAFAKNGGSW